MVKEREVRALQAEGTACAEALRQGGAQGRMPEASGSVLRSEKGEGTQCESPGAGLSPPGLPYAPWMVYWSQQIVLSIPQSHLHRSMAPDMAPEHGGASPVSACTQPRWGEAIWDAPLPSGPAASSISPWKRRVLVGVPRNPPCFMEGQPGVG